MKNLLLLTTIMITILLTACGSIDFDAVEVEGFIVNQVNEIEIKSYEFTEQGELVEDSFDVVPTEVLEYLEIDAPEVPELETEFTLELVEAMNDDEELEFNFETVTNTDGQFDSIEFVEAGTFTFEISQIVDADEAWTIADAIQIIVEVTEDTENEVLVANITTNELVFINVYTVDMSDDVLEVVEARYAEIVAERERIEAEERAEAERLEAERVEREAQAQREREAAAAQQQTPAPAQNQPAPAPAPQPNANNNNVTSGGGSTPAPSTDNNQNNNSGFGTSAEDYAHLFDHSGANCNNNVSGWIWVTNPFNGQQLCTVTN